MPLLPPVIATLLADTREYQAKMDQAIGKMEAFGKSGDTAGQRFGAFVNKASTAVIGAGVAIGAVAVKLAYDYTTAIDKVGLESNLTSAQLEKLKTTALDVSRATATSAVDIANAYLVTSKAGFSLAQSTVAVAQAAKFAKAENADLNATLSAAITIQKAGIPGTKSVTQTLDIFTNAIRNSRLAAVNLTDAFTGRAASAFAAFHIHLQDAVTLLAGFANVGLTGARSLMAVKSGLAALDAPMVSSAGKFSSTAKALAAYGLNQQTLAAETKRPGGFLDVLKQMDLAWTKNATGAEKSAGVVSFFDQIFGKTAGPAFTLLMQQLQSGKLKGLIDSINQPGSTNSAFSTWLKTPAGAWANFKTAAQDALIPLGNFLLPDLTKIATWAKGVLDFFKAHPLVSKIASDAAIATFGAAVAYKISKGLVSAFNTVKSIFTGTAITANTAATVANTDALLGRTATSALGGGLFPVGLGAGKQLGLLAAGVASFAGTTEILRHNVLGLGGAVNGLFGAIAHITGVNLTHPGTTNEAGALAAALKRYGITPGTATVALSPATIRYIEGLRSNPHPRGSTRPTRTHVKVTVGPGGAH